MNERINPTRLVDDLFELAQIDAGALRLEEASPQDLISDTLSTFRPQAERQGVPVVGDLSDGVDPVLMNPPKLQRVLYNLVSNALRHTSADGTVALRAQPDREVVRVEVADTDEGIASGDLLHVFERSFRSEKTRTRRKEDSVPGSGSDSPVVRGPIEVHGGRSASRARSARIGGEAQQTAKADCLASCKDAPMVGKIRRVGGSVTIMYAT